MGCDEHLYIEVKTPAGWVHVDPPKPPQDWREDPDHWGERWRDDHGGPVQWNFGRYYADYARLADVRNKGDVTPLFAGRFLPADVSAAVNGEHDNDEPDAHSATWFLLSEIQAEGGRIGELAVEMARVACDRGASAQDVRAVVWFDN